MGALSLPRSDVETEGGSRADTCNRHRDDRPEYGGAERIHSCLYDFQFGNVVFHDTIDLRLIGLAVGAVRLIVALLGCCLRPALLRQSDSLQTEGPELLGPADKLVETRPLFRRHERSPAGNQLFHGIKVFDHAVGKGVAAATSAAA